MKVLLLIPDLMHKGGVTNYYRCLSLDQQKDIDYMYVNTIATDAIYNPGLSKHLLLIRKAFVLSLIYTKFLFSAFNYQLIHVNPSLNFKSFFRDMVFILLSKMMGKNILVFFRGWEDSYEKIISDSKLLSFLFKYTYARADYFIVLGQTFKRKLISLGVNPDKKFYVETTIADDRYLKYLDIEKKIRSFDNEVIFLFISRILKEKGIYIVIDAFAKCKKNARNQKITLLIAGDGPELENAKAYVRCKNYSNISFVGYVKNDQKKDLLLKCHIMIFPTYYGEGLPNCILEGMLYGMPIISRVNGGIPDVVEHNVNGYLSSSVNSDVYADYCLNLIRDKHIYGKIARCNYHKAVKLFMTDAVRSRLLNIYKEILVPVRNSV